MKTKFNILAAAILLAAVNAGFGQPSITTQPQHQTNLVGTTATFWVVATGTPTLAHQWQKLNGTWSDLAACTDTNLCLTNVQTSYAGDYRVVITNVDGVAISDVAHLTVIVPPTLQFSTNIIYVAENASSVILTVQRTGDTNATVTVDYATANGTAMAGSDYTATNGTLTFLAGETNQLIIVPILNDSAVESATYETFTMWLSAPTNAVLGARTAANVRITDNDKGLAFEFASYSVAEDAGYVLIGVVRADDGDFPVSVDCFTGNGTAMKGLDYAGVTNTLFFAAGEKVQTFTVPILNDSLKENSKSFRVTLSNPTNQVLGAPQVATITILDNDPGVQFEFSQYWLQENQGALTVRVVRGNDVNLPPFTVEFASSNLTALAGQDYTETNGTSTFAAGEMVKTITVSITYDEVQEADETCKLTLLTNGTEGIVLGSNKTATITLLDTTGMAAHRFDRIAVLPDQSVQLTLAGGVHKRFKDYFDLYPIEVSTNLVDWTPLITLQRTNSVTNAFTYTDPQAGNANMRFYRTVTNQLIAPFRQPGGPFAVGVISRLLTDPTRRNRYGISTNGSFMVSVWYPAVQEPASLPSPFTERQYAQDPATQGTFTDRIPYFVGHALANAECATNQAPYPIVIYSPGWTGPRSGATEHAENLASHGYLVAAVDHFDAEGTAFPDGRYLRGDTSDAGHTLAGYQDRVRDLQFMLDELVRLNDAEPAFRGRLDLTNVAAMGFSWGGNTVAGFSWSDDRVKAVVFLDGSPDLFPGYGGDEVVQFGSSKPFLSIYSTEFAEKTDLYNKTTKDAVWFRISATLHGNLSGWYWWSYPNNLATGREAVRTVNAYSLWFLNKYLKGTTDPMPALADYPRVINFKQK